MACFPLPRDSIQTFAKTVRCLLAYAALFASGGCTCCATKYQPFATPAEIASCGVAERVLIPPDLNVGPTETVVKPAGLELPAPGTAQQPVQPLPAVGEAPL